LSLFGTGTCSVFNSAQGHKKSKVYRKITQKVASLPSSNSSDFLHSVQSGSKNSQYGGKEKLFTRVQLLQLQKFDSLTQSLQCNHFLEAS